MSNFVVARDNIFAFGQSFADAEYAWELKALAIDKGKFENSRYRYRKEVIHAWMPLEQMLHIKNVGCLNHKFSKYTELSSGKSIVSAKKGYRIFYYLMNLLDDKLSFSDITLVLKDEINEFFKNISDEFVALEDYPNIVCINEDNGFNPGATYYLADKVIVGIGDKYLGLKKEGQEFFYAVEMTSESDQVALVYYLASRAGVVINDEGGVKIVEQNQDMG